ncbi:hypothetical protein MPSEU_000360400 [Mayamaea pseudoterrestris]|nr:hypothetical protein MPSEU_000360400 [Mayamaea pseudoterrestris]
MTPSLETPPPQKILHYPIHGDLNGGTLILLGDKQAKNVVFLMGGFPDDHQAFLNMATSLAQNGCFVGVTCLPGYDRIEPWVKHPHGFTLEQIVAACGGAMYALVAQSQASERNLTCMFHDWGCVFGLVQANRVIQENVPFLHPKQLVLFDVCGPPHPEIQANMNDKGKMGFWNSFKAATYQLFFAGCFALQTHVSRHLAHAFYAVGSLVLFRILPFNPVGPQDKLLLQSRATSIPTRKFIYMMYPYYYMARQGRSFFKQYHLPKPNDMRVLYMYGVNKNVMFHTPGTLQYFAEQDSAKAKAEAVEDSGHWLYLHRPEHCLKAVLNFCFGDEK